MTTGLGAPPFTLAQIATFERVLARAWPAARTASVAGWTWRCSGGGSRRGNSVLALEFEGGDLDVGIADVEARYRSEGLRSYFHVSAASDPAGLDAHLQERGYAMEEPSLLLVRTLGDVRDLTVRSVDIQDVPSAAWLAIYTAGQDALRVANAPAFLDRVPGPRAFFLAHEEGEPVATALGVLSGEGIAAVECVATRADRRRSGGASRVMDAVEAWARRSGAGVAALQVITANAAARALYERRGYVEAARYHYRWREV